jgi:hypothetical protein
LVKKKNQTTNFNIPDKDEKIKDSIKLNVDQTERLNKLCEDIRILSINNAKKLKNV